MTTEDHWTRLEVDPDVLRISRVEYRVTTLGPGVRDLVVPQGCAIASHGLPCPGCIAAATWDPQGGEAVDVQALADELCPPGIDLSITGGDAFSSWNAAPIARLIDRIRARRPDLGVAIWTGYSLDQILRHGNVDQHALLTRTDLLCDGRYVKELHGDLRWRASRNQKLWPLTDRYVDDLPSLEEDRSAGLRIEVAPDLTVTWNGVPASPTFLADLEAAGLISDTPTAVTSQAPHEPPGRTSGSTPTHRMAT